MFSLQDVKKTIEGLDKALREIVVCPVCSKPMCGVVLAGKTAEQSGLCIGHKEKKELQDEREKETGVDVG